MDKRQDQNQNQNENTRGGQQRNQGNPQAPRQSQNQEQKRRGGNAVDVERQKKQEQEAPSREDWEGGASRPEGEQEQRIRTGRRRNEQAPKAGGTNEATEDENVFDEGNRYGRGEQAA
jgi:hypothetical protein